MLPYLWILRRKYTQILGCRILFARKIGADCLPRIASISRLQQNVGPKIENVRVRRRKNQWHRADEPQITWKDLRAHVLHIFRHPIESRGFAAVDDIRM